MKKIRLTCMAVAGLGLWFFSCARPVEPVVGGIYTVDDGGGFYRAAKVLALDKDGVHLRLYKNKWKKRPGRIEREALTLGAVQDADGFGIGHLVISAPEFGDWKPVLMSREELNEDEREGLELWRQGRQGRFVGKRG